MKEVQENKLRVSNLEQQVDVLQIEKQRLQEKKEADELAKLVEHQVQLGVDSLFTIGRSWRDAGRGSCCGRFNICCLLSD